MLQTFVIIMLAVLPPFALAFGLASWEGRTWLQFAWLSLVVFYWSAACFWRAWHRSSARPGVRILGLCCLVVILGSYGFLFVFVLQPGWLPRQVWYDCIANRGVGLTGPSIGNAGTKFPWVESKSRNGGTNPPKISLVMLWEIKDKISLFQGKTKGLRDRHPRICRDMRVEVRDKISL